MWHASVGYHGKLLVTDEDRLQRAHRMLLGVGDPALGEWTEYGNHGVVHVRRRLSHVEILITGLMMRDIRRTHEARLRYGALPLQSKRAVPEFVYADEVGVPQRR